MPEKSVEERVVDVIAAQVDIDGISRERVVPGARFVEDLRVDSLQQVEIVIALEDEFGVEIPDEDVEKMRTVRDAVEYLRTRI